MSKKNSIERILQNAKTFLNKRSSVKFSSNFTEAEEDFEKLQNLAEKQGLEVKKVPSKGQFKNRIIIRLKQ